MGCLPAMDSWPAASFVFCETEGEPGLRIFIHQDAGCLGIYPDNLFFDSVRAINVPEQALELIVRYRFLKARERFPVRRIGQRIAQVIDGKRELSAEEEEEGEEERQAGNEKARDHGLEFRVFNTMLAEC